MFQVCTFKSSGLLENCPLIWTLYQSHSLDFFGEVENIAKTNCITFVHLKQFWSTYQHHDGAEEMIKVGLKPNNLDLES